MRTVGQAVKTAFAVCVSLRLGFDVHASVLRHALEALLTNFFRDQLLEAVDGRDLLLLQFTPATLQAGFAVGVGGILIVAPKRIEPTAEILQQIVVVVLNASRFTDMLTVRKNTSCGSAPSGLFAK
jgi:hypothetical protein